MLCIVVCMNDVGALDLLYTLRHALIQVLNTDRIAGDLIFIPILGAFLF